MTDYVSLRGVPPPSPPLVEQFIAAGLQPVEYAGTVVHPHYWTDVHERDLVRLEWLGSRSPRAQGLVLRLRIPEKSGRKGEGGILQWGEFEAPAIRLWERTAGPVAEITCMKLRAGARLVVTNAWEGPAGVSEGTNNFGIVVEPVSDDTVVLHCSDGVGPRPDFRDMVVRASIKRA